MGRRLEAARIGLGFPANEPLDQKRLKDIKERKKRKKERLRKKVGKGSLAKPGDVRGHIDFQLGRAMQHISEGEATGVEIDYLSKHAPQIIGSADRTVLKSALEKSFR